MRLNYLGHIAFDCWQKIPEHFPHVELDAFVVMPNHLHGILVITDTPVGQGIALPLPKNSLVSLCGVLFLL
ncbi:MAG: hypothetical protein VKL59_15800 [Nostocaceae cyanobacterium]|nr:hypothetical protein [Nostocaceae cyanobacterium]